MPMFGKNGPRRNASAAPPTRAQLKVRSRRSTSFRGYRRAGLGDHAALAGRTFCDGAATAPRLCRRRERIGGESGVAAQAVGARLDAVVGDREALGVADGRALYCGF